LDDLEKVKVIYETMPGWEEDIAKCRSLSELPAAAYHYCKRISELCEVPISWIGVGPDRDDMFQLPAGTVM